MSTPRRCTTIGATYLDYSALCFRLPYTKHGADVCYGVCYGVCVSDEPPKFSDHRARYLGMGKGCSTKGQVTAPSWSAGRCITLSLTEDLLALKSESDPLGLLTADPHPACFHRSCLLQCQMLDT